MVECGPGTQSKLSLELHSLLPQTCFLHSDPITLARLLQVIARIHTSEPRIRNLIRHLLVRIGRHHPQVRRSEVCVMSGSVKQSCPAPSKNTPLVL